jgi:hypothetical protein
MTKIVYVFSALMICVLVASAQDEGTIVKKARIEKDKSLFIDFGPSFTLGKNIGDYSTGFNVELGFTKRMNRLLSIGPSISFMSFQYDSKKTDLNSAYVGVVDDGSGGSYYEGYVITLDGGDLNLISLAANIKLNLVPIKERTIVSAYAFVKPFVTLANRTDVNGNSDYYVDLDDGDGWQYVQTQEPWGPEDYPELKGDSKFTGGILIGPGIEIMPSKRFSGFVQAAFGYTFPIKFVSTESYDPTVESYLDEKFPMTTQGFPSINVQAGFSFNF